MTARTLACLLACGLLASTTASAPTSRRLERATPAEAAPRRLALVIGNDEYAHAGRLERAVADARAMATKLREAGLEVYLHENLGRRATNRALDDFVGRLSAGAVAVIFYAGHGVQVNNTNYLLPVDIEAETERDVVDDGVDLSALLGRIGDTQAAFSLAIVDACRNNPFTFSGRRALGGTRGLAAPTSTPSGFMVVYSAGANETALDKLGAQDVAPNGLFTRELLPVLTQPGVSISDAVRRVKLSVIEKARAAGHEQHPAIYDQSTGDFFLGPPPAPGAGAAPEAKQTAAVVAPAGPPADQSLEPLLGTWQCPTEFRSPNGSSSLSQSVIAFSRTAEGYESVYSSGGSQMFDAKGKLMTLPGATGFTLPPVKRTFRWQDGAWLVDFAPPRRGLPPERCRHEGLGWVCGSGVPAPWDPLRIDLGTGSGGVAVTQRCRPQP